MSALEAFFWAFTQPIRHPAQLLALGTLTKSLLGCSGVKDGNADSISIREMNSRRVGDKRALQTAFQEIVSGRQCRVGDLPPTGIVGIRLQMTDIREFFGTPIVDSGLTVERLEAATGWKSESIYHWLDEGLLECESVNLRGQRCRVVTPEQLLRFTRTYMPLSDVAKALGSRSGAMATKLRATTLVGAKLLPKGASRGALVRVEDLARLAIDGTETQRET